MRRAIACPTGSQTRLILCAAVVALFLSVTCLAADAPQVQFDISHIGPRQMEDVTGRNIPRDWGRAWQTLAVAFEQNQPDLLGHYFVGFAQQKLAAAIAAQEKSGLRTRYIDHGHKLAAYFYSPDGGAIELHDTADLEIQVLDGNTVIHSERATLHYIGLMTPAADHWEVRLLESVPNF
ncbi:MAG TPA: hypothetical protein VKT29_14755 [Terriglobales bacterium]|nr:hypothetical protein [Terriglobales bacterium]